MRENRPSSLPTQEQEKRELLAMAQRVQPLVTDNKKPFYKIVDESRPLFGRFVKPHLHMQACYIASLVHHSFSYDAAYNLVTQNLSEVTEYYNEEGLFVGPSVPKNTSRRVLRTSKGHEPQKDGHIKKPLSDSSTSHSEETQAEPTLAELSVKLADLNRRIEVSAGIENSLAKIGNSFQAFADEQEKVKNGLLRYVSIFLEQAAQATGSDRSRAFGPFEKDFVDAALTYDERYDSALRAHFAVYDKLFLVERDLVIRIVSNVSSRDLFILDGEIDHIVTNPQKGSEGEVDRLIVAWHKNFNDALKQNNGTKYSAIYLDCVDNLRKQLVKVSPSSLKF